MREKQEELKSAKQTSLKLGVSKSTLCRLMQRGEIGFFRVGSRVLFSEEKHIAPFLESCEYTPHSKHKKQNNRC
jgi:excisionase family DNA binding protein